MATDHLNPEHFYPKEQQPDPDDIIEALSIDNVIFGLDEDELKILLVKHGAGISKGKWALPGGWIRYGEDLREAASNLLEDHTGVKDIYLEQLKTFGKVDRFPVARVVTVAYYALVSAEDYPVVTGASDEDANWFSVKNHPPLVYDHKEILDYGVAVLRQQIRHRPIGFNLLPKKFTLLQLQKLYEAILDVKLDKPNFRRKILKMNLLTDCKEKQEGVAHRAANIYRFDEKAYNKLIKQGFSFEI